MLPDRQREAVRVWFRVRRPFPLPSTIARATECECKLRCRFTHDVSAYLTAKPRDIHCPSHEDISTEPPFVRLPDVEMSEEGPRSSLDPTTTCPVFQRVGECKHGLKCRFLGNHVRTREDGELELVVDEDKKAHVAASETEVNFIDADSLRKIRTKKVCATTSSSRPGHAVQSFYPTSTLILLPTHTSKSSKVLLMRLRRAETSNRPRPRMALLPQPYPCRLLKNKTVPQHQHHPMW